VGPPALRRDVRRARLRVRRGVACAGWPRVQSNDEPAPAQPAHRAVGDPGE
jgi:hypothetical protein